MRAIIIAALILCAVPAEAARKFRGFTCDEVKANVAEARKFLTEKQLRDLQTKTLNPRDLRKVDRCLQTGKF